MAEGRVKTFTTPIIVVLLMAVAFLGGSFWAGTRNTGQTEAPEETTQTAPSPQDSGAVLGEEWPLTLGQFSVTKKEICLEEDKPVVYFFGSERCSHCLWEHPITKKVMARFTDLIVFHDNMDDFEQDQEIWGGYPRVNPNGAVPFLVFGCKYARLGSGENFGEEEEERILTALACKLTGGEPEEVCQAVADLTEQID